MAEEKKTKKTTASKKTSAKESTAKKKTASSEDTAEAKKKKTVKATTEKSVKSEEKTVAKSKDVKKTSAKKKASKSLKVADEHFYGTGRRKSSVAKVWLFPGSGKIEINKQEPIAYLKRDVLVTQALNPIKALNLEGKYDAKVTVLGGGLTGQAGACQLGIARAILKMNETFRASLREGGFLTRDMREKERKKYGKRGARKGPQYRKR